MRLLPQSPKLSRTSPTKLLVTRMASRARLKLVPGSVGSAAPRPTVSRPRPRSWLLTSHMT
jgi:hypothetical protein